MVFLSEGIRLLEKEGNWILAKATLEVIEKYHSMFASMGRDEPSLEDLFSAVDLFPAQLKKGINQDRKTLQEFIEAVLKIAVAEHDDQMKKVKSGHLDSSVCVPTVGQIFFQNSARKGHAGQMVMKRKSEVCAYEAFLSQLFDQRQNIKAPDSYRNEHELVSPTILSLNYDTVIEQKANQFDGKLKLSYGTDILEPPESGTKNLPKYKSLFGPPEKKDGFVTLLKLHGSLNWVDTNKEADPKKTNNPKKIRLSNTSQDGVSNKEKNAPLIYPTCIRSHDYTDVFGKMLNQARLHLRLASKIVIIGYSIPVSDVYFRYLLADAVGTPQVPEVEICNLGNESEWRDQAEEIFGPRVTKRKLSIQTDGLLGYIRSKSDPGGFTH